MNTRTALFRPLAAVLLLCLTLALGACAGKGGKADEPTNPNEKMLGYGLSVTVPSSWRVAGSIDPKSTTKASLDERRKTNERILMLEALGPASARGFESLVGLFVVNQEGTFMPRDFAEKVTQEELDKLGKDLLAREKAAAKKKKEKSGLLNVALSRDTIAGQLAMVQRMVVTGPDGKPVNLANWDIYLPDGAGAAIKSVCDPQAPGASEEIDAIVKSLRIRDAK